MESKLLFSESQHFKTWWLWCLLLVVSALLAYAVWHDGNRVDDVGKTGLVIAFVMNGLVVWLFSVMKLETEIRSDGIYVRFHPFHRRFKQYRWQNLIEVRVRKYSAVFEYGGWGLRGFGTNRALNVSGNTGIQLVTTRGEKLLIGTRKPQEAAAAIDNYFNPPLYAPTTQ